MSPTARKLTPLRQSAQTYAAALQSNKQKIIDLWGKRVRHSSPAFLGQDSLLLTNSIAAFLDEISVSLSAGRIRGQTEQETSKALGRLRAKLAGYTLAQVLTEFQVLRETIVDVLGEEVGPIERTDQNVIASAIERGLIAAGSEFNLVRLAAKDSQIKESQIDLAQSETHLTESQTELAESESDLEESQSLVGKLREERSLRELFVSTLTHDLRNPLTAIRMSADLLRRKLDDPKVAEKLSNRISIDISRISYMIDNLLDANRIKAGEKLSFEVNQLDLNAQMTGLIDELTTLHGDRFLLQVPKEPVTGYWNWERLRRVIENLVTNAVKYGDPNTPITLSLIHDENQVRLSVFNLGNPIRAEDQATLFEQYRRTNSAKAGGQKGWGLGLTLVRGITEAHGGHVKVESAKDRGTTFTVILPKDSRPHVSSF